LEGELRLIPSTHSEAARTEEVSHIELLDRATAIEHAALRADADAVRAELRALRVALVGHLRAEEGCFDRLTPFTAELVRAGQQRLLALTDDLLTQSRDSTSGGACLVPSVELARAIASQARLEGRLLFHHEPRVEHGP
jgi:hypothetical protein